MFSELVKSVRSHLLQDDSPNQENRKTIVQKLFECEEENELLVTQLNNQKILYKEMDSLLSITIEENTNLEMENMELKDLLNEVASRLEAYEERLTELSFENRLQLALLRKSTFLFEVNDVEETVAKLRRRIPMETRMTQPTETIKKRRIDFSSPTAEMTVRTPISKKRKSNKLDN